MRLAIVMFILYPPISTRLAPRLGQMGPGRKTGAADRRAISYHGGMDEPSCPGCRALLKRVAELEALVAEGPQARRSSARGQTLVKRSALSATCCYCGRNSCLHAKHEHKNSPISTLSKLQP